MNKQFLKRLTEAHSWLGLIISGLLFIVFFMGSISLFRSEIYLWSVLPHHTPAQGEVLSPSEIMTLAIKDRSFNAKEHLTLVSPTDEMPFYKVYVDIVLPEDATTDIDYVSLLMDPVSGEIVANVDDFYLADFIYQLHYDLNIPNGGYIIGFVTLFFFFALISGIFIHARKLFRQFFLYRTNEGKRDQLLTMHNVIGVMSLPFTLMYAITGLIFNLVIIYQIAFALVLYKGDQQALLSDAGYTQQMPEWLDKPLDTRAEVDTLVAQHIQEFGQSPRVIRAYNYGDSSALLHIFGSESGKFVSPVEQVFSLKDGETLFSRAPETPNTMTTGRIVLSTLHFGDYGGMDLRVIYLILGLGVCTLIVSGNLLWAEKRQQQRQSSLKSIALVNSMTLGSTMGVMLATAMAFLFERVMPIEWIARDQMLILSFVVTLGLYLLMAFVITDKRKLLFISLIATAAVVAMTMIFDWILFHQSIVELLNHGFLQVVGVQVGLSITLVLLIVVAFSLFGKSRHSSTTQVNEADDLHTQATSAVVSQS
ncbi:PepSY domain-containing protein [Shewanella eurypsychrophilus]|uniref:PepSY domain-containing protein n=1 Tax=Shewanella eurypsychrophilus TaxID=2593656 RepID=A0ABX6V8H6_9GAMM|nr:MULTISPECIES: PepSY-associated TM helix domain-containing protein [Shewanella]QFU23599.1 PepSY domain-containing protein [Shewanella sp. YLB-09]QPG58823.1 PepSY domain-containing protein [Shewanella eurypsychrophilus]